MANVELTDVVDAISRLQLNYTSLVKQFYDIFFNPTPMYVTITFVDKDGEEVEVTIPNRAKDQKYVTNGEGSPILNPVASDVGTIYQDVVNGEVYIKYGEGANEWTLLISKNTLNSIIRQVQGSPEGSEVASLGTICVDTQNGWLYMKRTSTGNTGWVRIDSYATSKITEVFTFTKETNSIVLSGSCESKAVLSIFEDGLKLNPDTYDMPYGDNKTIILRKPIEIPGEGETVEVLVEYFIDTHVAESSAEQRLVDYVKEARFYSEGISEETYPLNYIAEVQERKDLPEDTSSLKVGDYYYCILEKCNCIWNGAEWEYEYSARYWRDQAKDIYDKADLDITNAEQAIAEAGNAAQAKFQSLYDDTYNLVETTREYIDENYEKFSAGVNRVDNYAQEVAKNRTAVEIMLEDIKQLEKNTYNYANYVEVAVNDLATKTEFNNFKDEIESEFESAKTALSSDIQETSNNLNNKIDTINETLTLAISDEVSERTKAANKLQGTIEFNQSTFENWTTSHSDLRDFTNNAGYFKRDNMPFDLNGIYRYSSSITTLNNNSADIIMTVTKDCSYYSVDIGEYMETVTKGDSNFTFTINPDMTSIDFSLPDKLKNNVYTKNYDNVVCVARCYIQNSSKYTPSIDWDYTKISWLGSEPELDPTKSYIVEFISYDMMSSWEAHILGMCQPSIDVDTFTASFTVTCDGIANIETGNTSEVKMVAIIDNKEITVDDVFEFDNTTHKVTVPMEIERKFLGKTLNEIQLKSTNTPAFTRYYANADGKSGMPIVLGQNQTYTVECMDNTKPVDAAYRLHINSDAIDTYMRGGLSLDDYHTYQLQQATEQTDGVTFVDNLPENGGQGLYVLNSDLGTYWTWYQSMEEWKSSTRVLPTSEFITSLDVKGKFKFDFGNIDKDTEIDATYYYSVEGTTLTNGVQFDFNAASGVMTDPLVIKGEDNHVTNIKLRYDALEAGYCIMSSDTLTVKTGTVSDPATVYVNAEGISTWEDE